MDQWMDDKLLFGLHKEKIDPYGGWYFNSFKCYSAFATAVMPVSKYYVYIIVRIKVNNIVEYINGLNTSIRNKKHDLLKSPFKAHTVN